jgi:hypothetical protein
VTTVVDGGTPGSDIFFISYWLKRFEVGEPVPRIIPKSLKIFSSFYHDI